MIFSYHGSTCSQANLALPLRHLVYCFVGFGFQETFSPSGGIYEGQNKVATATSAPRVYQFLAHTQMFMPTAHSHYLAS